MKWTKAVTQVFSDKKHRTFAILCAAAIVLLLAAHFLMARNVKTDPIPALSNEAALPVGVTVRQELTVTAIDLSDLRISFVNRDTSAEGTLTVALYENETLVQQWDKKTNTLRSGDHIFTLAKSLPVRENASYAFTIRVEMERESPLAVQMTANIEGKGGCAFGETPSADRVIAYHLSYQDAASHLLDTLHYLMYVGLAVLFLFMSYILIYTKVKLEVIITLAVFLLGMVFMVAITPCSPPDEPHHYRSAYELSNYMMFRFDTADYGESVDFDAHDLYDRNVSSGYLRVFSEFGEAKAEGGTVIEIPTPRKLSYFVEYVPQAVGITLGRLLGRNFVTLYMLGRLFNLVFYTVCVYFALKKLSRFKLQMGLIAMLPMALHQAASLSYDAFVNGMAFLLIAYILELIYSEQAVRGRDMVSIGVIAALLGPAKVIYCPILLMLFFVPKERFGTMKKKLLAVGAVLAVCALAILMFQLPSMMEISGRGDVKLNHEGQYNYTLSYIFKNPIRTVTIFGSTLLNLGVEWLEQGLGSRLSSLNLLVPTWIVTGVLILLVLSAITDKDHSPALKKRDRLITFGIAAVIIALVMLSMFVGWTSNTSPLIQGVQGRYFIPVFPLLLLCLCGTKTYHLQRNLDRPMVMIMLCLNLATLVTVVEYTMIR